jgi:hypothetical protein
MIMTKVLPYLTRQACTSYRSLINYSLKDGGKSSIIWRWEMGDGRWEMGDWELGEWETVHCPLSTP